MINIKSTLSFIGAALLGVCAFIADMPGEISNQIPQLFPYQYRGVIALIFALAAYALHHYGAGVRIQKAVDASPTSPESKSPLPLVLALCFIALSLSACAQFLEAYNKLPAPVKASVTALTPIAKDAVATYIAQGGSISNAQAVHIGVQAATAEAPVITSNAEFQKLIVDTAVAWSGDPKFKAPAQTMAAAVGAKLPANPTKADYVNALVNLGVALSAAANPQ